MDFLPASFHTLDLFPKFEILYGSDLTARIVVENRGAGVADDVGLSFAHAEHSLRLVAARICTDASQGGVGEPEQPSERELPPLSVENGRIAVPPLEPLAAVVVFATFQLTEALNDGTPLAVQALLHTDGDVFGSNVAIVTVRSVAEGHATMTFEPAGENRGTVEIVVHSVGADELRDVAIVLSRPAGCEILADTLTAAHMSGGRPMPAHAADAVASIERLPVGTALCVRYDVEVVAAQRRATLELPAPVLTCANAEIAAPAPASARIGVANLGGFTVFADDEAMVPGVASRVRFSLWNEGRISTGRLVFNVKLADGLHLAEGSQVAWIGDRQMPGWVIDTLAPNCEAEFAFDMIADAPMSGAAVTVEVACQELPDDEATVTHSATFTVTVDGYAQLDLVLQTADGNDPPGELIAGESCPIVLHVRNAGNMVAKNAVAYVNNDEHELGDVGAGESRRIDLTMAAPKVANDRDPISLHVLTRIAGHVQEPSASHTLYVRAQPKFKRGDVSFASTQEEPLEPGRSVLVEIEAANVGSAIARDVAVALEAFPAHAVRMPASVSLGDVAPGALGRVTFELHLLEAIERDAPIRLRGRLAGANVRPIIIAGRVDTRSVPEFVGTLTSATDTIDVGASTTLTLCLQNIGDALARRVRVRAKAGDGLDFVPGSLRVGDRLATYADDLFGTGVVLDGVPPKGLVGLSWDVIGGPNAPSAEVTAFVEVDGQECAASRPMRTTVALVTHAALVAPSFSSTTIEHDIEQALAPPALNPAPTPPALAPPAPPVAPTVVADLQAQAPPVEDDCGNCEGRIHFGVSGNVPMWFHENGEHPCPGQEPPYARFAEPRQEVLAGDVPQTPPTQEVLAGDVPQTPPTSESGAAMTEPVVVDETKGVTVDADSAMLGVPAIAAAEGGSEHGEPPATPIAMPSFPVIAELDLSDDRLDRITRLMKQAQQHELASHLFSLRAFFPDRIIGCEATPQLDAEREALKLILDRLLLRMQMRRYVIDSADLETRASRDALVQLVQAVVQPVSDPDLSGGTDGPSLAITVDREALRTRVDDLARAPLGSALPFLVTAHFFPDRSPSPVVSSVLRDYRTSLLDVLYLLDDDSDTPAFLAAIGRPSPLGLDHKLARVLSELAELRTPA